MYQGPSADPQNVPNLAFNNNVPTQSSGNNQPAKGSYETIDGFSNDDQQLDDQFQNIENTNQQYQQLNLPESHAFSNQRQLYNQQNISNNNNDDDGDANDTISFALDEINAVINSKDFCIPVDSYYTTVGNTDQQASTKYQIGREYSESPPENDTYLADQQVGDHFAPNKSGKTPPDYYGISNTIDSSGIMATKNNYNNLFATNGTAGMQAYNESKAKPYVEIVEQPAKCALRFRYKCEGRSAGSLPGVNSTTDSKTYPAIRINNYVGRAVVVISCVGKDAPYRAHPHNIVGKEGCKKGICTIVINNEPNTIRSFTSLGIQCVKRKEIEESLSLRESINVDPFRNGFEHKLSASNIDLNVVRLCFQVFIEGSTPNKCDVPLIPAVSEPIHDKKAMSDLVITKLSHCSAPATGGREIILLCDRIAKDDIQIRFYEERDGKLIWETYTDLSPADIHKQVAICFKTPKYYNENIAQPAMARVQLKRISDNQVSEPRLFQFLPCESDEDIISRKRQKIEWVNMNHYAPDNSIHQAQHNDQLHHRTAQQQPRQQQQLNQLQSPQPSRSQRTSPHPIPPRAQPARQLQQQQQQTEPDEQDRALDQHQQRKPSPQPQRAMLIPQQPRPSHSNQHQTQQQRQAGNMYIIENEPNLVVRHEIIDDDGKVMRLVDRPGVQQNAQQQHQQQLGENNQNAGHNKQLGSSLDRIDTAELMRDMPFNSNMDLNLQI